MGTRVFVGTFLVIQAGKFYEFCFCLFLLAGGLVGWLLTCTWSCEACLEIRVVCSGWNVVWVGYTPTC